MSEKEKPAVGTQVQGKKKEKEKEKDKDKGKGKGKEKEKEKKGESGPCPWLCNLVPTNVPAPGPAQAVLHPNKDVFVLKVAKVGSNGDRRCKMELELVTPKGPDNKPPGRVDTREAQCDPEPPPCCCMKGCKKKHK